MKRKHTFLIADDNPVDKFLNAKAVSELGHTVVGLAETGKELIDLADQYSFDYILCDTVMPKIDGFTACKEIKAKYPDPKIICVTSFADLTFPSKLKNNLFDAYLLKGYTALKLNAVIEKIDTAAFVVDPLIKTFVLGQLKLIKPELSELAGLSELARVTELAELKALSELSELSDLSNSFTITHNGNVIKITDRHILLVSAIYHSKQREEIASLMCIAPDTVDQNIKRFKQKMGIDSKMELVKLFVEWGLIAQLH